jgi:hypothetical protein
LHRDAVVAALDEQVAGGFEQALARDRRLRGLGRHRRHERPGLPGRGGGSRRRASEAELVHQAVDVGLDRRREVDAVGVGEPLDLEAHQDGEHLAGDLLDVDVRAQPPPVPLGLEDRADQVSPRLVPPDEEVVQRVTGVEALRAQDDVEPRERGGLGVVPAEFAQARQRQRRHGIGRIDSVALLHHLLQQAFLGAEVVQEPRGRHADPIGQRGDTRPPVALGREQLHRGVEDPPAAEPPALLAVACVGAGAGRRQAISFTPPLEVTPCGRAQIFLQS